MTPTGILLLLAFVAVWEVIRAATPERQSGNFETEKELKWKL